MRPILLLHTLSSSLNEPLFVFGIIMLVILLSHVILQRIKVPSLVGYILAGVVLGPEGLGIITRDGGTNLLGSAGLLFIMFTAGLELNIGEFRKKTGHSLIFGFFTFFIPLLLGYLTFSLVLKVPHLGALLIGSMFATQTLVAYPIVARYQIQKNESVATTVGATIFTDTAVLLLLAFIVAMREGQGGIWELVRITLLTVAFIALILLIYPRLGRWFFRHNSEDKTVGIIFLLTLMFAAGILSKSIGLEPIIGAFIAGIGLNRQVAGNHILHNRVEFLGSSLFIPFFLISVGMIVDPKLLIAGPYAWYIAFILIVISFFSKWLAAWLTQVALSYNRLQRRMMFGLSSSHAAATIAVIFIGFKIGLIDLHILNGTIILILISCLGATLITESAAREMATLEKERTLDIPARPDRVVVPVANPNTANRLLEAAFAFRDKSSDKESVYALAVIDENGPQFESTLQQTRKFLNELSISQAEHEKYLRTLLKIDINVVSGIIKTMKEISASTLVLGWGGLPTPTDRLFGNLLQRIVSEAPEMIVVTRHKQPIHNFRVIRLMVPPHAEYETGFFHLARKLTEIASSIQARIDIASEKNLTHYFSALSQKTRISCECKYIQVRNWGEFVTDKPQELAQETLYVYIMARNGTLSYHPVHEELPQILSALPKEVSFMAIYPEQSPMLKHTGVIPADEILIQPLATRFSRVKKIIRRLLNLINADAHD
ncbi:MAG: cation:proton antiporter [Bacteroidales bacterium]